MSDHQLHGQFTHCLTLSSAPRCHRAQAFPLRVPHLTLIYTKGNPPSFCSLCFASTFCVAHQQPCICLHLLLYFSLARGMAECLEEQERLTPDRNIIQRHDLQQRKRENTFAMFSFATLRLAQTIVPCSAYGTAELLPPLGLDSERGTCEGPAEMIRRMGRWVCCKRRAGPCGAGVCALLLREAC